MNLNASDKINIALCILSFVLAAISVITVIITLRQNSKMIENSTRPYITIYGKKVNFGILKYYLIVKNFGSSGATITNFTSETDLSKYADLYNPAVFKHIIGTHLAPQQSIQCTLDINKLNKNNIETLSFQIEYVSSKKYKESVTVNYIAETENAIIRSHLTPQEEIKTVSEALQGIGESML